MAVGALERRAAAGAIVEMTYGLPSLPLFAVYRGKDGCWNVLAPESDFREPCVRVVAMLREPGLNAQLDVSAKLATIARTAAAAVRSTKVRRSRGRAGGVGGAWLR
jgi:hypothetical protein